MNTINFYNKQSEELLTRYNNANMSTLYKLFLKYIPLKSKVLDIGFGSGRDLEYLKSNDYDIWGIDPSIKFVNYVKTRFPESQNHFLQASLPFKDNLFKKTKFDAVISIAVWMHLHSKEYKDAVESILNVSRSTSVVIISYSIGKREQSDERYFETVDLEYLTELFSNADFKIIDMVENQDSLKRDSLTWVTVVFKHD